MTAPLAPAETSEAATPARPWRNAAELNESRRTFTRSVARAGRWANVGWLLLIASIIPARVGLPDSDWYMVASTIGLLLGAIGYLRMRRRMRELMAELRLECPHCGEDLSGRTDEGVLVAALVWLPSLVRHNRSVEAGCCPKCDRDLFDGVPAAPAGAPVPTVR